MPKSLYLVNPKSDYPTYFSANIVGEGGHQSAVLMADLATASVGAMASKWLDVSLCDDEAQLVDLDTPADYVGLTGKITQGARMTALAAEFRARGKKVLIGGPYASLSPELLRPHCDILVRGEIETIADQIFSDLANGTPKDEYIGTDKPDLALTPPPRWDLYPNGRALRGTIQISRGCPFECEFCDVIQYLGRKQRHKPIANILAELDSLYAHGYRGVFIADDNFTAFRSKAKEILLALKDWNSRQPERMNFATQVSIDAARDDEMLQMCSDAGITSVFIGIETPNAASLKEAKKRQNLRLDLTEQITRFLEFGIAVNAGMIVGFDNDGTDIFERQFDFAMSTPVPIFSLGALVAPAATPLYARMSAEGRLLEGSEVAASPWSTNIVPKGMSADELMEGLRWLCNRMYSPEAFGERLLHAVKVLNRPFVKRRLANPRAVDADFRRVVAGFAGEGPEEAALLPKLEAARAENPGAALMMANALFSYRQIHYMYRYGKLWEPHLANAPAPKLSTISRKPSDRNLLPLSK